MFIHKLQYTPSLVTQRKKVNISDMKLFIQIILDILSGLEPDIAMLHSTFLSEDEEVFAYAQDFVHILRDTFPLPHLREAINTATREQWQKTREDYLSLCDIFGIIEERKAAYAGELLPEDFIMGLKITGALWLT